MKDEFMGWICIDFRLWMKEKGGFIVYDIFRCVWRCMLLLLRADQRDL